MTQTQFQRKLTFKPVVVATIAGFVLVVTLLFDFILGIVFIPKDYNAFRKPHEYYHHTLAPNRSVEAKWGDRVYPMYTNSLGFRDASPREVPLTSDKRRVLMIGDSHTEAVGVPFEKSFAGVLARMAEGKDVEILNAAAVSYSPKIYYLKTQYLLEEVGLDVDELFVFIDISDIQNEIGYQDFEPESIDFGDRLSYRIKKFLERRSVTYYSINAILESKRREDFSERTREQFELKAEDQAQLYASFFDKMDNRELLNNPDFHNVGFWLGSAEFMEKWGIEGLELGAENMRKLAELCKKHDIELTISVHPWTPQIYHKDDDSPYIQFWKEFAVKNRVRFISMFPLFINDLEPVEVIEKFYIPQDNHWNEMGHLYVGRSLAKVVFPDENREQ